MEKVKIVKCIDSGKKYQDKQIVEIELADGRKGSAFDTSFLGLPLNQEIEVEVKNGKIFNGVQQYYFMIPGQQKPQNGSKFPQKDWTFEKKKAALESSINWCITKQTLTTEQVLQCAKAFYEFLNTKPE